MSMLEFIALCEAAAAIIIIMIVIAIAVAIKTRKNAKDETSMPLECEDGEIEYIIYSLFYEVGGKRRTEEPLRELPAAVELIRQPIEEIAAAEVPAVVEPEPMPVEEVPAAVEPEPMPVEEIAAAEAELAPLADENGMILLRYNYSFMAKLIQSTPEIQRRYGELYDFVLSYKKIKAPMSWKKVRVYSGREVYALFTFRGKKLCMSFALDPNEFAETKYRGLDMSQVKKYERTPMMLKLTSDRKMGYAKYLFALMMERAGFTRGEVVPTPWEYPYETREQLISEKLIKLIISRSSGGGEAELVDLSTAIRERMAMKRAENIEMSFIEESVDDEEDELPDEPVAGEEDELPDEPDVDGEEAEPVVEEEHPAAEAEEAEEEQPPVHIEELVRESVSVAEADEILTDSQAEKLIDRKIVDEEPVIRIAQKKAIINIDTLSANFAAGDTVTLDVLKEKKLLPFAVNAYKVLARGTLDKPLTIEADGFSIDAVKMIVLTGGHAVKV